MKYSNNELLDMYYNLVKARKFVLALHDSVHAGLIRGSFHTQWGQEATGVGIAMAMGENDWIIPSHRLQSFFSTKLDLTKLACEMLCKRSGYGKGVAFDVFLTDLETVHSLPVSGTLGGAVGHAAGGALALKVKEIDGAFVIHAGDGAWSEGVCYEVVNIATLLKLPIVFVAECNGWAMTVPQEREAVNASIAERVAPWGVEPHIISLDEGCNAIRIREEMEDALAKARKGNPQIVEINNTRWEAHFLGQGNDYYTEEQKAVVEEAKANRDCVKIMADYILSNGVATEAELAEIDARVESEMEAAFEVARNDVMATPEEIYDINQIYASPETGGEI